MALGRLPLALWALPLCGASVEDTSAMVQSRKAASLSLDLDQPEKEVPDFGTRGVRMTRLSASGEPGATFQLSLLPFCDDGDQFGPTECAIQWGQVLNSSFKVHLPGGIEPGDILTSSYTLQTGSFNKSSFFGTFVPKYLQAISVCQFCEGQCSSNLAAGAYIVNTSSPTKLDNQTLCNDELHEDLELELKSLSKVGKPPADLNFAGDATIGIRITNWEGNLRLDGAYVFTVGPNETEREALESGSTGPMTLMELVRHTAESTVSQALAALHMDSFPTELNLVRTEADEVPEDEAVDGPHHVFVLNITLRDVQESSGTNLSVWYDKGCEILDAWGSVACRVPLGELVNSTVTAGIWLDAEEGSTIRQKSKISLGGTFGILMSAMLEETEYTVPLCGNETTTVMIGGAPKEVVPVKCGTYTFDLQTLKPQPNMYMDFANFDLPKLEGLPFLPRKVDQLMPVLVNQELDLKHKDGSSIGFLNLVLGIDKA